MIKPLKKITTMTIIVIAGIIVLSMSLIYAFLTSTNSYISIVTVGEVKLELVSDHETNVKLLLTSPTFLLDPTIVSLYETNDCNADRYVKHQAQFKDSCYKITVKVKNIGNVPSVIGYGSGETSSGIDINLIDQDDLAGIAYVALPHDPLLTDSSDYYTHLLNKLNEANQLSSYTNFEALKTSLAILTNQTIDNVKKIVLNPNEEVNLDIFIWQEYYDGDYYISQYENINNKSAVFIKQDFIFNICVYLGQLNIN